MNKTPLRTWFGSGGGDDLASAMDRVADIHRHMEDESAVDWPESAYPTTGWFLNVNYCGDGSWAATFDNEPDMHPEWYEDVDATQTGARGKTLAEALHKACDRVYAIVDAARRAEQIGGRLN